MAPKQVAPSANATAFSCPHCGVLTTQTWFAAWGASMHSQRRTPVVYDGALIARLFSDMGQDKQTPEAAARLETIAAGHSMIGRRDNNVAANEFPNLHWAVCYDCGKISIWIGASMIWPESSAGIPDPNGDLPEDIRADYLEAGAILQTSPRGSAALLRLCIQKLFVHLGEKGSNINDDIASLVRKGLDPTIQMALDVVRVVGNEAVHPGQMDLSDDSETASELFRLVNIVAETMITQKRRIAEIYAGLPKDKLAAIVARDTPKAPKDD